jgi:hypothetical protein
MTLSEWMRERALTDKAFGVLMNPAKPYSRHTIKKWRDGSRSPRRAARERIIQITEGAVTVADMEHPRQ